jgi:hypothetical protein
MGPLVGWGPLCRRAFEDLHRIAGLEARCTSQGHPVRSLLGVHGCDEMSFLRLQAKLSRLVGYKQRWSYILFESRNRNL